MGKTFNAFTKSYRLRYVVHAAESDSEMTLCGRKAEKVSRSRFDDEADGACKKCIQKIAISKRIHPGWDE